MKTSAAILFLSSCSLLSDEIPVEARRLTLLRDHEVAEIEGKYQKALLKLRDKYAKTGRFEDAKKVDSLIEKVPSSLIGSKWEYRIDGDLKSVFTIKASGKIDASQRYSGISWKKSVGGFLQIVMKDGRTFTIKGDRASSGDRTIKRVNKVS